MTGLDEHGGQGVLHVGETAVPFQVHERHENGGIFEVNGANARVFVLRERNEYTVWYRGRIYRLHKRNKDRLEDAVAVSDSGEVKALMPGKVLRVEVNVGDSVEEKQALLIMESMKMESTLQAPKAGRVSDVRVAAGAVVDMGQLLIVIE
jgi:biotin carboxyl carrier protein